MITEKVPSLENSSQVHRDLLIVVIASMVTWIIAGTLDLAERWIDWAALGEIYQLDEIIFVLLVCCIGLIWFGRRRYNEMAAVLEKNLQINLALEKKHQEIADLLHQNRALVKHITLLREAERNQLATELHDVFGQYLAAIDVNASVGMKQVDSDTKLFQILETIQSSAIFLRDVTRMKLRSIKPPGLETVGLSASVKDLISLSKTMLIDHQLNSNIEVIDHLVKYDIALTIYRCLQEGLVNVSRHAGASKVTIDLQTQHWIDTKTRCIKMTLQDNGQGFVVAKKLGNGLGLIGMRERILALSGQFEVSADKTNGTFITCIIPLSKVSPSTTNEHTDE